MDIGSLLFLLLILVAVIYIICRPFYRKTTLPVLETETDALDDYQKEYDQVIKCIRELEFEAKLRKISDEDQALLTEEYQLHAAVLLGLIEKTTQSQKNSHDVSENSQVDHLITDRKAKRRERFAGFCANCKTTLQKSDRFCPKCGKTTGVLNS
ncbi:MAG: hypothetical protein FD147_1952 [Chloroflexi bacterium]|nr:MAG: hypothetical protein FD147_1952 [Chloroflexota bacterium]MBA4376100.1 hypothetical protein [Anaerolinea sp.]